MKKPKKKLLGTYHAHVAYDPLSDWVPLTSLIGTKEGVKRWIEKTYPFPSRARKILEIVPVAVTFRRRTKR